MISGEKKLINRLNSLNSEAVLKMIFPAGNYLFKVNNRNARARCELCSNLTLKIPERRILTSKC